MTQQTVAQRQQTVEQAATILAGTATVAAAGPLITNLLAAAGVSAAASSAALTLIRASSASPVLLHAGPASRAAAASEQIYRAAYLVNAAERIQSRIGQGMTLRQAVIAERPVLNAHRRAVANRRSTAAQVDNAAKVHGLVLGWKARMDASTSDECQRANGRNFSVLQRPVIGWPGSVHPTCRCRPVAPFADAGWVDEVATETERREAVA